MINPRFYASDLMQIQASSEESHEDSSSTPSSSSHQRAEKELSFTALVAKAEFSDNDDDEEKHDQGNVDSPPLNFKFEENQYEEYNPYSILETKQFLLSPPLSSPRSEYSPLVSPVSSAPSEPSARAVLRNEREELVTRFEHYVARHPDSRSGKARYINAGLLGISRRIDLEFNLDDVYFQDPEEYEDREVMELPFGSEPREMERLNKEEMRARRGRGWDYNEALEIVRGKMSERFERRWGELEAVLERGNGRDGLGTVREWLNSQAGEVGLGKAEDSVEDVVRRELEVRRQREEEKFLKRSKSESVTPTEQDAETDDVMMQDLPNDGIRGVYYEGNGRLNPLARQLEDEYEREGEEIEMEDLGSLGS